MIRKRKVKKVLVWIFVVFIIFAAGVAGFIFLNPVFGGKPDKADLAEYARRTDYFVNGKFVYPDEYVLPGLRENNIVSEKDTTPKSELPTVVPSVHPSPEEDKVYITWMGHSTVLLQIHGLNLLFDPIYSEYSSPVQFAGPKRFSYPPLSIEQLPKIDAVILTHDHYDHLDMNTIKQLNKRGLHFIVPLGVDEHLIRWGVPAENITTLVWWEEFDFSGLTIACTPTRHYSGRLSFGSNTALFASWVLRDEYHQLYFCGDSGYGSHFRAIHEKYGDFEVVLMDGAQYNMAWHASHMFPEESVMACEMLGAKLAMPIHWGAFSLAPHGWDDPVIRFTASAEKAGIDTVTPLIGATVDIDDISAHQHRWWEEIE